MKAFAGWVSVLPLALLLAAGCKSEDSSPSTGGGGAPTIVSFTATPASVPVSGDSVRLAWKTSGATSLAITPGVGTVTPADSGSRKIFVNATTTFTLTATNTAGSVTAQTTVVAGGGGGTITVSGRVLGTNGVAVPNVPVVVTGKPATTSDASGGFTVAGVSTPYDVTVVYATDKISILTKGLTRPDPTLWMVDISGGTPVNAAVSGTVSGGVGYPEPASHRSVAMFVSPETGASSTVNTTTGAYTLVPSWTTPAVTTGDLHALQWQTDAGNLPTAYKGYGKKSAVTLVAGGSFSGQNIAMSGVVGATFTGSVTVPAGFTLSSKAVRITFGSPVTASLLFDGTAAASFTYTTPNVPGATFVLTAGASKGGTSTTAVKVGLAANATGVGLTIPAAPELSLPVNAAANVDTSTVFSWSPFAGGVYYAILQSPGNPLYVVLTSATTAAIPNQSALGLALPKGANYSWRVIAIAPAASVDAACGPTFLLGAFYSKYTIDSNIGTSDTRTFTTKP